MTNSNLPRPLLIATGFIQGVLLLALHLAIEHKFWPSNSPQWLYSLYTIAIAAPIVLLLSVDNDNLKKILNWTGIFILISGFTGYYLGSQLIPPEKLRTGNSIFVYAVSMSVATFKFLMYTQQRVSGLSLTYSQLFLFSWRNFITLALSALFTLVFWGILMLWAALFKMIQIKFFYQLFTDEWFIYPVLGLANAAGIIIFRNQQTVIDVITRIQQALMKFLLVLLVFVIVLFLIALPFTGLEPLWKTNSGSALILWIQALTLFFLNAVYQDDAHERPYHLIFHRFIYAGIALLPVYSAISFYGLSLRIEQYGWSVERCWAILIWAAFALFSVGYLWGIIKQRDQWTHQLSWVNIRVGLVVMCLMFLVNTPVADFRKISVNSQMARLTTGEIKAEKLDFWYFKNNLGTPGYQALQTLKNDVSKSNPDLVKKINDTYNNSWRNSTEISREFLEKSISIWPKNETLPQSFKSALFEYATQRWRFNQHIVTLVLVIDLNKDGNKDYLVMTDKKYRNGQLFYQEEGRWKNRRAHSKGEWDFNKINQSLSSQDTSLIPHQWERLKIGELIISINNE